MGNEGRAGALVVRRWNFGQVGVELVEGSITSLGRHVDAIVSSDDNELTHGGGVSRAIWKAAGPRLATEVAQRRPRLSLGDVHETPPFGLDADHLLHAVTIDFDSNRRLGPADAVQLYTRVFEHAAGRGCRTIAVPLLGSGAGRLGTRGSAHALALALRDLALRGTALETILVPTVGDATAVAAETIAAEAGNALPQQADIAQTLATLLASATHLPATTRGFGAETLAAIPPERLLEPALLAALDVVLAKANDEVRPDVLAASAAISDGRLALDNARLVLVATHPTSGMLARELERVAHVARWALPRDLPPALREAIEGRNRLVHGLTDDAGARRQVLNGLARLHAFLLDAAAERLAGEASSPAPPKATHARSAPKEPAATTPGPGPSSVPYLGGTQHVRLLRDLLLEHLEPRALDDLLRRLANRGFKGDHALQVLELCVTTESPADLLVHEFAVWKLRELVEERTRVPAPDATAPELALLMLEALGFPVRAEPRGLASAMTNLRRLATTIHGAGEAELAGLVTRAASHLEYVLQVLLRFVCQAAWRQSPEAFFRARHLLKESERFERCSLGRLFEFLEALSKAFETEPGHHLESFRSDVTERLAPKGTQDITRLRNSYAHFDRQGRDTPVEVRRTDVDHFFKEVLALLDYLAKPDARVCPIVLRVERISIDRWGRRVVEAVTDEGTTERLFTDEPLVPGSLYFMRPLSNPLRVDPILVPAGDLDPVA